MRTFCVLLAVMLLAGCAAEYVPEQEEKKPITYKLKAEPAKKQLPPAIPELSATVLQERGNEKITWGFDSNGRLALLNSTNATVVLEYDNNSLVRIDDGAKPLDFSYDNDRLVGARRGMRKWVFRYSTAGKLLGIDDSEKLEFTHDSKARLSSFSRNDGQSTEFAYDKFNRTAEIFKAGIRTKAFYDSESRLARLDRENDHLVIGYWRENLLSALSGTMYGLKETANYGSSDITLVSNTEPNVFSSTDQAARMSAFNTFLFCTRFRKLPVLFDSQSWVIYREYLKGTLDDYVLRTFVCEYLP
jgi:hypothetical protein